MQVFATLKALIMCRTLNKLTCYTKQRKVVKIMKLTIILLLGASFQLSAKGISQTITLALTDAPLEKVFHAIEKQTEFTFFVKDELLSQAKNVTINVKSLSIHQVLDMCFKNQPLKYAINGKIITIAARSLKAGEGRSLHQLNNENDLIDVKGRVVNENNEPIEGVNVTEKGTKNVTATNVIGEFFLKGVAKSSVLIFTSVSMERFELKVEDRNFLDVALRTKVTAMQEVVINKGYYTETRKFSTGNVAKISSNEIERQPVSNVLLALQGRVPGLFITQNTGVPGGGIRVQINGRNNLTPTSGSDPLYIIDGVPYSSQMLSTFTGGPTGNILNNSGGPVGSGAGNPLNYINPADIESIEVLMDADATAIYGSRAANGAILITTKKGRNGPIKVNVDIQNGWGKIIKKIDLLNTQEYREMRREAFKNDNVAPSMSNAPDLLLWDSTRNTDWQEKLIGNTAQFSQITTSVSGGNSNSQYLISGTYQRQTSVFPGNFEDKRGSMHFNINGSSSNQKFNIQLTGSFLFDKNLLPANDFTNTAIALAPNAPEAYKQDGSLNWENAPNGGTITWINPYSSLVKIYETKTYNIVSNAVVSYKLFPFLNIRSSFGYTYLQANEFQAFPNSSLPPEYVSVSPRNAWYTNSNINSLIIEPQVNFQKAFSIGKIDFLAGATIQQRNSNGQQLQGAGYNSDQVMRDLLSATSVLVNGTDFSIYKYNALYSRFNYNLKDKYILNLTARRDGSSRFGSKNQFHNFWSIGSAWIFTEENLIKHNIPFVSFGKIRGNYGTSGNDQIGDYRFMNLFTQINAGVPYQGTNGLEPTGLPNPYFQWEETKKLQIGIDLGFYNDRINVSGSYIENKSSNHLLSYLLPINTGFSGILENFPATIKNSLWEFVLNTVNVKLNKFKWSSNINLTIPKNKLVDFPNYSSTTYASGTLGIIPGYPLGVVKAYHYLGINPSNGLYQVEDINGNPTSQPVDLDRKVIINPQVKYYGGISNNITYKSFELNFLFQFVKKLGNPYLFRSVPGAFSLGEGNQPKVVLTRWQKAGDVTNIRAYTQNTNLQSEYGVIGGSDFIYQDASYIRLKNVSFSWQIPSIWRKKIKLQECRLYLHGQNLLTITNFKGLDPENNSVLQLPPLKMFTVGLQVSL